MALTFGCRIKEVQIGKLELAAKGDCVDYLKRHPNASREDLLSLPFTDARHPPSAVSLPVEPLRNEWEDPILFDQVETPEISATILPVFSANSHPTWRVQLRLRSTFSANNPRRSFYCPC